MKTSTGHISQIIGPVVDVTFESGLPSIYNELKITLKDKSPLTLEVEQQISDKEVRAIALGPTEGLTRGMSVEDTGAAISVPVGDATLGRIFNVVGAPIDNKGDVQAKEYWPIHKSAPSLTDQETSAEMLETGIKVVDLIAPFARGGKVAAFIRPGLGNTVILQKSI